MAIIHVLDEKTINKIAAGEVVERPASVIKELVENAIDAGANNIRVEIAEGGTTYMRVTDDGCGMEEEDARLALLRHATSKIRHVEDLFDIASLGFRGEALASISAVSHFTLRTRTAGQSIGTSIQVDGGVLQDCEPVGCAVGTEMEVKDLFYNTPARRKFLKTPRTEASRIQDLIGKLALSHPQIAFTCVNDDRVSIMTPGTGSLEDTVAALYGYKVAKDIFSVAYEGEGIYIDGVAGKPSLIKSSRMWQTIIVNNRVITDKVILKAIDRAYHAMVPKGAYPLVVLRLVVPADSVDINVHPRKQEVKFADEKAIFSAVYRAVCHALERPGMHSEAIATDIGAEALRSQDVFEIDTNAKRDTRTSELYDKIRNEQYRPPMQPRQIMDSLPLPFDPTLQHKSYTVEDKERFHKVFEAHRQTDVAENTTVDKNVAMQQEYHYTGESLTSTLHETKAALVEGAKVVSLPAHGLIPMGQVASCYILAKKEDCLYIVDQHAAHERVRYDILCNSAEAIPSQELLLPMHLQASEEEMLCIEERPEVFADLGFDVTLAGPTELKIQALPADFDPGKGEEMLRFIFSQLAEGATPTASQLRHELLAYASCRGAIKAGHNLNLQQMGALLDDLFRTEKPYVCPHGRPTMLRLTTDELAKLFLRA